MYYDRHGEPMDLMAWARAFEDAPARTVARTQVGESTVITMWLGMDEDELVPPRIFGSIIKTGEAYRSEIRTCTQEEAMQAHLILVSSLSPQG